MDKKTVIKNYFADRLKKIPPAALVGKIPESSELFSFLTEVGLVEEFELFSLTFYFEASKIKVAGFENQNYLVIGDDYGTSICAELQSGDVYSVDLESKLPKRFINSSAENLLLFIMVYEQHQDALEEAGDDEDGALEVIAEITEKFNEYDARALDFEENWWAVILEQAEVGLL